MKGADSLQSYTENKRWPTERLKQFLNFGDNLHLLENKYSFEVPLQKFIEAQDPLIEVF